MIRLVDYKDREIKIGQKVLVERDIPSIDGMLHKDTIVKIDEYHKTDVYGHKYDKNSKKIRVTDSLGKIYWVSSNDISASFL